MKADKKMELLGSAPVSRALVALGVPTMAGMLINALYNLVDAWFVGGLGKRQMGAISVVFPLGQAAVGLGLLFGSGAASYLSRLLGRGERANACRAASTALYGSLLAGALFIVPAALFLRPVLRFLGATDTILPYAVIYGRIILLSSILNVFNVTMNNLTASEGAAQTAMCALLAGAILNIGLDPLLIYGWNLGITGAAIATAISQGISALVYLIYILRRRSVLSYRLRDFHPVREDLGEILKIGIPTLVFQLLASLAAALTNRAAADCGDGIVAVLGAVTRVTAMGTLVVFGFLKGFQPIAGFSYGARRFDRLREATRTALRWSTLFCVAAGLLAAVFSGTIVAQFTADGGAAVSAGQRALAANGLSFCLFGWYTVYSSLLLALGRGKEGFLLGACRQGICFLPVILLLPTVWGLNGILYAQPIADVLSALVTAAMAARLHRQLRREEAAYTQSQQA